MRRLIDITGMTFGRLYVVGRARIKDNDKCIRWACICECGNIVSVINQNIQNGHKTSCGCLTRENKQKKRQEEIRKLQQERIRATVSGNWSREEDILLSFYRHDLSIAHLVYMLKRSRGSIKGRLCRMGIGQTRPTSRPWTEDDLIFVEENRSTISPRSMSIALNRSISSIRHKLCCRQGDASNNCNVCGKHLRSPSSDRCPDCYHAATTGAGSARWEGGRRLKYDCVCDECGCAIQRRQYEKYKKRHHFCSEHCRAQWWKCNMSGENGANWKGGRVQLSFQIRASDKYREWRIGVFERDNYTCRFSGINNTQDIHAHHIIPFAQILKGCAISTLAQAIECEALWDVDNGITLDQEYHAPQSNNPISFHATYGTVNSSRQDFVEWFLAMTPETCNDIYGENLCKL